MARHAVRIAIAIAWTAASLTLVLGGEGEWSSLEAAGFYLAQLLFGFAIGRAWAIALPAPAAVVFFVIASAGCDDLGTECIPFFTRVVVVGALFGMATIAIAVGYQLRVELARRWGRSAALST